MDMQKFLRFVNEFNIDRKANHIFVNHKQTKKLEKLFHASTSDETESMLQAWIQKICEVDQ